MQIEFTKEQYESLLKLVYCWNLIINWARLPQDRIDEYDNLCSHIYSKWKDFWKEDLTQYWEEEKKYIASNFLETDEDVEEYIKFYNDDIFWNTLVDGLVDRDLEEKSWKKSNNIEEKIDQLSEYYWEEFSKNSVKNLKVIEKNNKK